MRPTRGHQQQPVRVGEHLARAAGLACGHVQQQRAAVHLEVLALVPVFQYGLHGQVGTRPHLPVRVRIRATHLLALVLEDLHPAVTLTQPCALYAPAVDHRAAFGMQEFGQRARVVRRIADHAAAPMHRLRAE